MENGTHTHTHTSVIRSACRKKGFYYALISILTQHHNRLLSHCAVVYLEASFLESRLSNLHCQEGKKEEQRVMIAFGAGSGGQWHARHLAVPIFFHTCANLFVTRPISCTHCPTCCHNHLLST